jgi:hypothetical protein
VIKPVASTEVDTWNLLFMGVTARRPLSDLVKMKISGVGEGSKDYYDRLLSLAGMVDSGRGQAGETRDTTTWSTPRLDSHMKLPYALPRISIMNTLLL